MIKFSESDKQRITAAIHAAEQRTSGEFVAVVARASDRYFSIPLLWAAALALLVPGFLFLSGLRASTLHLYQLQLLLFAVSALLLEFIPPLHMALVPKAVRHLRASRLARAQFYAQGVHLTREHSGVLFFVSLAERYVEIVADLGIHEQVGEEHWRKIVETFVARVGQGDVTGGFVEAIGACGEAMAKHYPAKAGDTDELSDGLIEI
jgi:putative membrane protein